MENYPRANPYSQMPPQFNPPGVPPIPSQMHPGVSQMNPRIPQMYQPTTQPVYISPISQMHQPIPQPQMNPSIHSQVNPPLRPPLKTEPPKIREYYMKSENLPEHQALMRSGYYYDVNGVLRNVHTCNYL